MSAGPTIKRLVGYDDVFRDLSPGLAARYVASKDDDPRSLKLMATTVEELAMKGDEYRARDAGCEAYVAKPIDTRALPLILSQHLGAVPVS